MKILTLMIFLGMCTGCATMRTMAPQHIGVSPSLEVNMTEGCYNIYKPKVQMNFDWEI